VDNANRAFADRDGALFNKDFTRLILYPEGKPGSSYAVPEGVTHIGEWAFSGCESLASITLPAGLTAIGNKAFSGCESLESITLPASLTAIGMMAFGDCLRLASISVLAIKPPALGGILWFTSQPTVIYVPASAVDAYKQAEGWKDYADRIHAIKE
jgi:hypothetical protein